MILTISAHTFIIRPSLVALVTHSDSLPWNPPQTIPAHHDQKKRLDAYMIMYLRTQPLSDAALSALKTFKESAFQWHTACFAAEKVLRWPRHIMLLRTHLQATPFSHSRTVWFVRKHCQNIFCRGDATLAIAEANVHRTRWKNKRHQLPTQNQWN